MIRFFFAIVWIGIIAAAAGQTIYAPYAVTNLGGSPGGTFFFDHPYDVAIYHSTNIYVAATSESTIHKITLQGGTNWVDSILAGSPGNAGSANGNGGAAQFDNPESVAVDDANNVYVADSSNGLIRKITPDGNVTTLADLGDNSFPINLAVDSTGNIYASVTSNTNYGIRKISPGGALSWFLIAEPLTIQWVGGVDVDQFDNVYVADYFRNSIYRVTPAGVPTLIAGTGSHDDAGSADGISSEARFDVPNDVAVSTNGDIFVADSGTSTLRRIRFDGSNWVVRTMAGSPGEFGSSTGIGSAARFQNLAGLVVDDNTHLIYAADIVAGVIRVAAYAGPTNDFNSWTNPGYGKWETATNWSAGAPSVGDTINVITNAGTKAVLIDSTTVSTALSSLKINNLLVSAPDGDINGLALFNSGTFAPLQVTENLVIDSGGVVAITNGAIKAGTGVTVGFNSGGGILNVLGGGNVTSSEGYVGRQDHGGNAVQISGVGSLWTNQSVFVVGSFSGGNGILIDNGGTVSDAIGVLGDAGNGNLAAINGNGSAWRNSETLVIGDEEASGNALSVVNGGAVYVNGEMIIGTGGDSNVVTVANSGTLICSGSLRLEQGGASIYNALYIGTGASVTTPSLSVSNGNFIGLAAGTLNTGGTIINNGIAFPIGVGVEAATLRLSGGIHTFANGVEVTDHGLLTGCGTVIGPVTIDPGGTIVADCGTLTFIGPVTNNGTIQPLYGTNVIFQSVVVNYGSILTNNGIAVPPVCPNVVTGAVMNLNDSATTTITDGTNSVQLSWSLASPGNSGFIYTTANTAITAVTNITTVEQITNAAAYIFLNSGNVGPLKDASANGGNAQFVLLRNKSTGHYCAVRMDDVTAGGKLNASWWFQSQSGSTNFGCVPPPSSGPSPATNFVMQSGEGNLTLSFATEPGRAYTIQMRTNLAGGPWTSVSNLPGDGTTRGISISPGTIPRAYFRVQTQ